MAHTKRATHIKTRTGRQVNTYTRLQSRNTDFKRKKESLLSTFRGMLFSENNPYNPPFVPFVRDRKKFPSNTCPMRIVDVIDEFTRYVLSATICDLCGEEGELFVDHTHGEKTENGEKSHSG
mmetsp:Transcript_18934/g.19191  ORF Transcript_18934/g.19191 Transcript_18934/m.19191 type:complete len:122 (+) Transcript_18934:1096-1461(+)